MKRLTWCLVIVLAVALAGAGSVEAAKKIKERKGQVAYTFTNQTGVAAYGLVVTLSDKSIVVYGDDNRAGPFGNVKGNDTSKLTMTNPHEPIPESGQIDLTFQSYSKSLKVSQWWWLDSKGKRLGDKQKG
ncbi:MAG: hypothetical protein R3344_02825 [Acidobacteriota bacterium]|nr:hypothetical protein [Acidobacteriota bacterium]